MLPRMFNPKGDWLMFRKFDEKGKLTLKEQKDLNEKASSFLIWTTIYWFGVLIRLLIFFYGGK